ncbi:Hypothetical predicted protein [Olea europaea subsp. europaea]|uniref:Uncharacterized protein n=1 Tax=Olea europaea subsp. europaea TaxID=158383 RepID=A0A8S0UMM1_OLEEU|nr:Hypothetical predicted protein [Olea europaea subsp. europaea]
MAARSGTTQIWAGFGWPRMARGVLPCPPAHIPGATCRRPDDPIKWGRVGECGPIHSSPHSPPPLRTSSAAMAPKREYGRGANDHEAGSSWQIVPAAFAMAPPAAERERIYVTVAVAQMFWEAGTPMPWGDVHLPHGWHLSPDRVSVPPIPATGHARLAEIRRHRDQLPPDLLQDPAYAVNSPHWELWFETEHDQRRRTFFASRSATAPPPATPATPRTPPATARRPPRRNGGLYINEPAPVAMPPPPVPAEEDDPEFRAALAASAEANDLEELGWWPHLGAGGGGQAGAAGRRCVGLPRDGAPAGGGDAPGRAPGGGGAHGPPHARGGDEGGCGGAAGEGGGAAGTPVQASHPAASSLALGGGPVVAVAGIPGALRRLEPQQRLPAQRRHRHPRRRR